MKRRVNKALLLPAFLLLICMLQGCKAKSEIMNIPTPKPEQEEAVVIKTREETRTVSVKGSGTVMLPAEYAHVTLRISASGASEEAARALCMENMIRFAAKAREMGIPEIETVLPGAGPDSVRQKSDRAAAYTASGESTFLVEDLSMVDAIIGFGSVSEDAGTAELAGIRYGCHETAEAEKEALLLAMEQASDKATYLAEKSGLYLGEILTVEELEADETQIPASEPRSVIVSAAISVTYDVE